MGKLVYYVATSVDNFICDRDGGIDTNIFVPEGDHVQDFFSTMKNYDAVLMGGKTYEFGFRFGMKPGEPGYKGIKHYVFSKSLDFDSTPEVQLVKERAVPFISNLRSTEKSLWLCGGGELASSLLEGKLIDELILKINPGIMGEGRRLFGSSRMRVKLELMDLKRYNSGVILSSYRIQY